jgi:DNA-binding PucR family transcriptional regulator
VTALPLLSPLDYLLTVADDTARRLIPDKLRAVVEQEPELLATLEAYADCDLNVRRTAGVLGLHPNTVHDRLRRLGDKVGTDARRVHAVVDLLITARLLTR